MTVPPAGEAKEIGLSKREKPLTEILAGIYVRGLSKASPGVFQPWENLSEEAVAAHVSAMHSVVAALDLFNLTVSVDSDGHVVTQRDLKPVARGERCPQCKIINRCG